MLNNLFKICASPSAFLTQLLATLFSNAFGFASHEVSIPATQLRLIAKTATANT